MDEEMERRVHEYLANQARLREQDRANAEATLHAIQDGTRGLHERPQNEEPTGPRLRLTIMQEPTRRRTRRSSPA
jgi:hypothetical protein